MAVTAYGRPLEPIDLPEPELLPGHALLEVVACGVCYSDVKTAEGRMPFSADLRLPHVPGHEICARVVAIDPPGAIECGTHVVVHHYSPCGLCAACRAGEESLCSSLHGWIGFTHPGGFEERLVVPIDRLFTVPEGVDPVHAAPLTCAIGTAYRSVVSRGGVQAGARVLVIGLGGVGIHTVQVARACGAQVLGLDPSPTAVDAAGEVGVPSLCADRPDVSELRDALGGHADVVVDNVGQGHTLALGAAVLRPGGRLVGVGYAPETMLAVSTPRFVLDELELVGSRYVRRDELQRAIDLVAAGSVKPVIGAVRPLDHVNEALDDLREGRGVGRGVVQVREAT